LEKIGKKYFFKKNNLKKFGAKNLNLKKLRGKNFWKNKFKNCEKFYFKKI